MNSLTCTCVPALDGLSPTELERLFPDSSNTALLLSLLQESGIEGFNLRSIVVSNNGVPILLLPLFETRFDLSAFVKGWIKETLKVAGRLMPSLFQPRILSVGTLAAERNSDILALYNFNQYGNLPGEIFQEFNRVQYRSCARLSIDFSSIEDYLSRLSRGARKDVRRKMRAALQIRVVRSRTASPFLDRIYALYLETVSRGPMSLGVHNRLFFEKICERVPGAEYMLYFVQEELVAFNLLIAKQAAMVDIFFCIDRKSVV